MDQKLTKSLINRYPALFTNKNYRGSEDFVIECGDGWFSIIDSMCNSIYNHYIHLNHPANRIEEAMDLIDNGNKDQANIYTLKEIERLNNTNEEYPVHIDFPVFAQIKEKFGGMRVYIDNAADYSSGIVDMAEKMSYNTCEVCGNKGEIRKEAWVRVLCDEHAKN